MDRRVLLRMPSSLRNRRHGQEKGATRIQQHLKPVTLDMVALTILIEYVLLFDALLEVLIEKLGSVGLLICMFCFECQLMFEIMVGIHDL